MRANQQLILNKTPLPLSGSAYIRSVYALYSTSRLVRSAAASVTSCSGTHGSKKITIDQKYEKDVLVHCCHCTRTRKPFLQDYGQYRMRGNSSPEKKKKNLAPA